MHLMVQTGVLEKLESQGAISLPMFSSGKMSLETRCTPGGEGVLAVLKTGVCLFVFFSNKSC